MSKRFGRNQKRKMRAQLAMERELHQASEKANRHTIRELKSLLESRAVRMEEMEHAIRTVVRAVHSRFPELLAFNGEPVRTVTFCGGAMRVDVPLTIDRNTKFYHQGQDERDARQFGAPTISLVEFEAIVQEPDVMHHLSTLVHFYSKAASGERGAYRMSVDLLSQDMAPSVMQQYCIDVTRHAMRQIYASTAKMMGRGHGH